MLCVDHAIVLCSFAFKPCVLLDRSTTKLSIVPSTRPTHARTHTLPPTHHAHHAPICVATLPPRAFLARAISLFTPTMTAALAHSTHPPFTSTALALTHASANHSQIYIRAHPHPQALDRHPAFAARWELRNRLDLTPPTSPRISLSLSLSLSLRTNEQTNHINKAELYLLFAAYIFNGRWGYEKGWRLMRLLDRPKRIYTTKMDKRSQMTAGAQPITPFPIRMQGGVIKGFGRGSKDLGIPTANLPEESIKAHEKDMETGIYYGWAKVSPTAKQAAKEDQSLSTGSSTTTRRSSTGSCTGTGVVYPMVMSLGWNPFYKNEKKSAEVHIMHKFETDFYGQELRVVVMGYIRPELDYTTLEALIEDINIDIEAAHQALSAPGYCSFKQDELFTL